MIRDRAPDRDGGARSALLTDTGPEPARWPSSVTTPPGASGRRHTTVRAAAGAHAVAEAQRWADQRAPGRRHPGWSRGRLAAAVSASRSVPGAERSNRPFADELDFFAANGRRRDVRAGTALVDRGSRTREVHLVERGAVAVLAEHDGRKPILTFALRRELCCAVPALLHQNAPWDVVAVTDAAMITVPADVFTSAVRERWVERWTTRTLTWLAEVGARVADLDAADSTAQAAALLLRAHGDFSAELCRRTIADLLDLDDFSVRVILDRLDRLGAVELSGSRIAVTRPDLLRKVATCAT